MKKCLGKVLLLNAVTISCCVVGAGQAIADDNVSSASENLSQTLEPLEPENLDDSEISPSLEVGESEVEIQESLGTEYVDSGNFESSNEIGQVNSVFILKDVSATDWAFQALRSLVEKYSCIAGYPDSTFRGNRALSRYEFAAVLNSCLQQVETLINTGSTPTKDDLDALSRLARDFEQELAEINNRLDNLESTVSALEDNQFSTTTKLSGLVFFNLTHAMAGGNVKVETGDLNAPLVLRSAGRDAAGNPLVQEETDDPGTTFSNLIWLTLNTSFSGKDSLVTQLAVGNGTSPANAFASAGLFNTFGVPFMDQTAGVGGADIIIRELFYSFPVNDRLQLVVGPRVNWYRYFDGNAYTLGAS